MADITVSHLSRHFQVYDKLPGLASSISSLFHRQHRLVKAVDDISFSIDSGELVGFIGPNGAGKTTTLKCLSGLLYPTSGSVDILGYSPSDRHDDYLRQIGFVMGQKNQLWWDIPPQETFLLNKAIYDISDVDYRQRLDFFIENLDLGDIIRVQTKKLSLGQRMKCEFVAALLHQPKVLFLDEPTIGLDVVASLHIRQFIKEINKRYRTTVILTSHNMADVQQLCRRVVVIDRGKIYFDGELVDLTEKYNHNRVLKFTFFKRVTRKSLSRFGEITSHSSYKTTFNIGQDKSLSVASYILANFPVSDLNIESTPIEDVVRQIFTDR